MDPAVIENLLQLGFAAAVAGYLIYFQTTVLSSKISENTKSIIGLQMVLSELYRLLVLHDAQVRGLHAKMGEDQPEAIKIAGQNLEAMLQRIDKLTIDLHSQFESLK